MSAGNGRRRTDAQQTIGGAMDRISERYLMTVLGSAMWITTTFVILGASLIDAVAPENLTFWRLVLGIPALTMGIGVAVIGPRLSDRAFRLGVELNMIPALAINVVLLQLTPSTPGVLYNLMVTLIFAGYFLRMPALVATLSASALIALSTLFTEPASQTPYLGSFLVVYIAVLVVMPLLLHVQNSETLAALATNHREANTDPLTGLANLRALRRAARETFKPRAAKRGGAVAGLLLIDLDNFKSANSAFGHLGGDHALRAIAEQLLRVAPPGSTVGRVGGDEFAVVMRAESAERIAERGEIFRAAVRAANSLMELPGMEIDASVGVAIHGSDGSDVTELIDVADRRMYANKGTKRHPIPDLERKNIQQMARPQWLTDPSNEPFHEADATLERITGGRAEFLGSRTLYTRTTAIGWIFGTAIVAISLAVPSAYADTPLKWWMALIVGAVAVPAFLIANVEARSRAHLLIDVCSLFALAGLMASTGGARSAIAPMLVLLATAQAWFWQTELLAFRFIGPVLVAVSPLLYMSLSNGTSDTVALIGLYSLAALLVTLVAAMYFDRYILVRLQDHAQLLAMTDPLTGIANRRRFEDYVQQQLDAADGKPFAIVMIDLDNFKQVNTEHGHLAGDKVLREIGFALSSVARGDDCVARVGGDEFAAVLPGVDIDGARSLAERLVQAISDSPVAQEAAVGASAGFALYPLHGDTLDQLVFTADNALMMVKATGKGATRVARVISAVK